MAQIMDINHVFQEREIAGKQPFPDRVENTAGQMQKQRPGQAVKMGNHISAEKSIPVAEKVLLTLEEAALLTGIGQNKLREISNGEDCPFVLWNGSKRMFKREKLISYLSSAFSI